MSRETVKHTFLRAIFTVPVINMFSKSFDAILTLLSLSLPPIRVIMISCPQDQNWYTEKKSVVNEERR